VVPARKRYGRSGGKSWTEFDAAVFREEQIIAAGWEQFNKGAYGSNAKALNEALGQVRFAPWSENGRPVLENERRLD
jgi:hypothetical protein